MTTKTVALTGGALALLDYATTAVVSAATASAYVAGEAVLPFPTYVGTILFAVLPLTISFLGLKESARTAFGILTFHVSPGSKSWHLQWSPLTTLWFLDVNHVCIDPGRSHRMDSKWKRHDPL